MRKCACGNPSVRGKHAFAKCTVNPESMLAALRLDVDMVFVEPISGERMWLKECHDDTGKRIGITECCLEAEPCDWHKSLAKAQPLIRECGLEGKG